MTANIFNFSDIVGNALGLDLGKRYITSERRG